MSTADTTSWADFTRSNYRRLLIMAKASYEIMPVGEFSARPQLALWRHDVDASPQAALAMASIEQELGVRATYYFNAKSEFYNLLEPAVSDIARRIAAMGHEVGVHFDAANADIADSVRLRAGAARRAPHLRRIARDRGALVLISQSVAGNETFRGRQHTTGCSTRTAGICWRRPRTAPTPTAIGASHPSRNFSAAARLPSTC